MSSIETKINRGPVDGHCSTDLSTGDVTTLFNIRCSNWSDSDGLSSFAFYRLLPNQVLKLLGFTGLSSYSLRLPFSSEPISIVVHVADAFGSITEVNLSSIIICENEIDMNNWLNILSKPNPSIDSDAVLNELKNSKDSQRTGQIIHLIADYANRLSKKN